MDALVNGQKLRRGRRQPRPTITLHGVYLALAKTPIEGPARGKASFDLRAASNTTVARMMTAVLRNQQAASEYA